MGSGVPASEVARAGLQQLQREFMPGGGRRGQQRQRRLAVVTVDRQQDRDPVDGVRLTGHGPHLQLTGMVTERDDVLIGLLIQIELPDEVRGLPRSGLSLRSLVRT
ncbi:hypothetical protein J4573_27365 [Actinomadura barringtoniae]|uniref:Uncharacterized protein n=1 Tax=Actinomadura barringtoniae TaxID=1427535 RepID=A0A939T8Z3_9ACTN|nr:hypothetical protein [Actinomadura barringtoniae]MBO2450847.1 hypothetical protein [Actinomadura barringtoniae]